MTATPGEPAGRIALRPVDETDHERLAALYASTRAEEVAQVTTWTDEQREAFLRFQFEAQTAYYAEAYPRAERSIVEVDGEWAGRLYLDRRADEIRVVDIALLPAFRGRGIGTWLLRQVFEQAAAADRLVRIHVEKHNPARELYLRLGFAVIEDKGVYDFLEWRAPAEKASPSRAE